MRQRFPGHTVLVDFTDVECYAIHVACMAPHNAQFIAEIQKNLQNFYADAYHGGAFREPLKGIQFYREPAPNFFELLRKIVENEVRNFASALARCTDCGWVFSQQEYWRSLSSVVRKISEATKVVEKRLC